MTERRRELACLGVEGRSGESDRIAVTVDGPKAELVGVS